MATGFIIWAGLLGLVTMIWADRHRAINRAKRSQKPLSSRSFDGPPTPAPKVSVLVAAKDEQNNIEACVTSLLTQDYPALEVIAINDRSTDRTAAILDEIAAQNGQSLQVIHIRQLREGWFGKNNAMREGVDRAAGEWLCFTDADCRQISTKTLSIAMRYALDHEIDFLSVLPVLEAGSFWERVCQPVCAAIMVMWFRPERVNDPRSRAAYANGAFMLMKRQLYDALGGHERIKTEVNEDMHLARLTKEAGRRLYVIQNEDLYRTRMYASFGETWRGWSRIFYGCFGNFRRLLISALVLCLASIFPWASLLAGTLGWVMAEEADAWMIIMIFSVAALVAQLTLLVRFYGISQADPRYVPTYILGALVALGMLLNAMLKLSGRTTTTWRGTTYRGREVEEESRQEAGGSRQAHKTSIPASPGSGTRR